MSSFEPGQVILGKYRVERVLGRGGMGVVLSAVHVDLDAPVAVKVLQGSTEMTPDLVSRFLREAQAASKLRSEFVARVTDFGRIADGQPFMVMELLDGEDYETILTRGPLPPTEAVDAILQAGAALAEAHAAGIVHRDIKPSNLFRTSRPDGSPCVKVLDFGISKVVDPLSQKPITHTGHALGTPFYMSPEQIRSPKDVDERTDIWSLGVVLYEMLAGRPPFDAEQIGELFARILEVTPEPLSSRRPELPAGLAEVVMRCLTKNRDRRVSGMRELAELLLPFASSEGGLAARRASISAPLRVGNVSLASPAAEAVNSPASLKQGQNIGHAETMSASSVNVVKAVSTSVAEKSALLSDLNRDERSSAEPEAAEDASASMRPAGAGWLKDRRVRWSILIDAVCVLGLIALGIVGRATEDGDANAVGDAARAPTSLNGSMIQPAPSAVPAPLVPAVIPATSVLPALMASAAPSAPVVSAPPLPIGAGSSVARPKPTATAKPAGTSVARPSSTTLW